MLTLTHALRAQHNYNCKADKWEGDNTFMDQTKADLKTSLATYATSRSAAEWEAWVDARTFWVTETKCAPLTTLTPSCPHPPPRSRAWQLQLGGQQPGGRPDQRGAVQAQLAAVGRRVGRRQHDGARPDRRERPVGVVGHVQNWDGADQHGARAARDHVQRRRLARARGPRPVHAAAGGPACPGSRAPHPPPEPPLLRGGRSRGGSLHHC